MGRGRAKAKQTKVARELKYFSPDTDLNALERELRACYVVARCGRFRPADDSGDDGDYNDYARWASSGH